MWGYISLLLLHFPFSASGDHALWKHIAQSYLIDDSICLCWVRTYCAPHNAKEQSGLLKHTLSGGEITSQAAGET